MLWLALLTLGASIAVVSLDAVGARASRRLGISYGWVLPLSLAFYAGLGLVITQRATVLHALAPAAVVALADVTLGGEMARRAGVLEGPSGPITRAEWVRRGLIGFALMVLTAVLAGMLITPGIW